MRGLSSSVPAARRSTRWCFAMAWSTTVPVARHSPATWRSAARTSSPSARNHALGVTTSLIYVPNTFAKTPELIELASEAARCGGLYSVHMRNEGDRLLPAIQETIDIARASGGPAEIYHFKQAGKDNWGKLDAAIALIEDARKHGTRITADMYTYTAGATGFDASMPPWVQDGGLEKWIERLKDPATRARVKKEMLVAHPADWENFFTGAVDRGRVAEIEQPSARVRQFRPPAETRLRRRRRGVRSANDPGPRHLRKTPAVRDRRFARGGQR